MEISNPIKLNDNSVIAGNLLINSDNSCYYEDLASIFSEEIHKKITETTKFKTKTNYSEKCANNYGFIPNPKNYNPNQRWIDYRKRQKTVRKSCYKL